MTPAEIAKKLTPAQVRALRKCHVVGHFHRTGLYLRKDRYAALCRKGLITKSPPMLDTVSDLGRAVLAELDKGEGK